MPHISKIILAIYISTTTLLFANDEHKHHDEDMFDEYMSDEHEFEEHGAHEHGHATAQVSYGDNILEIQLKLPAIDVFGFEHEASTTEQHEAVELAELIFNSPDNIYTLNPSKPCTLDKVDIDSNIMAHNSAEHHDSEDMKHDEHEEHSDVSAVYISTCKNLELETIEFNILEKLSTLKEIEVQFVSDEKQLLFTASPKNRILKLN